MADRGRFSMQHSGEGGEPISVPRVVNSLPAPLSDTRFVLFYPAERGGGSCDHHSMDQTFSWIHPQPEAAAGKAGQDFWDVSTLWEMWGTCSWCKLHPLASSEHLEWGGNCCRAPSPGDLWLRGKWALGRCCPSPSVIDGKPLARCLKQDGEMWLTLFCRQGL